MGGHHVWIVRAVAIVALVTGLGTGCSGQPPPPDAAISASASTSAQTPAPTSPTTSATPTGPAALDDVARARIPKPARAHTPQGAEAFARFYLDQVNKAWTTPDPDLLRPYALPTCKTCANYAETAAWLVETGFRFDRVPGTVGPSGLLPESTKSTPMIQIVQQQLPVRLLRGDGSIEEEVPKGASLLDVALRWRDDSWHIETIKGERP